MDTQGIAEFQKLYKTARDHNSKELRLSIAQAERISLGLTELTLELATMQKKYIELQAQLVDAVQNPKVDWNGGRF